jgi:Icc-related predicted phosphoesterase
LKEAIGLYKDTRPKIVISHAAPSEAAKEILKDLNGSHFLDKHGDVKSRTSKTLQEMVEVHQPSAWSFGHFHLNQ